MLIRAADKSAIIECNWESAKFYCLMLNHKGQSDWRLPTYCELKSLIRRGKLPFGSYWTSTLISTNDWAYGVTFEINCFSDKPRFYPDLEEVWVHRLVAPVRTFIPNQYKKVR